MRAVGGSTFGHGMPRRKKNGLSPARQPAGGPPEGGSLAHVTGYPPPHQGYDQAMASTSESSRTVKQTIVKSMQEMFSHLDPEVIYIVLSECDFKVENAMDSLLELSVAAEVAVPHPAPVSGFERTAAALLSPHHFSGTSLDVPSSSMASHEPKEELDMLIDQELEALTAQQDVKEEQHGSVSLASFPPPPVLPQVPPELLLSSPGAVSAESFAEQCSPAGGLVEPSSGASSPLDQLSTWEDETPEGQRDVLDFTHLTNAPLNLAASGRPSAFQVYKKQDPSHALSERTGPVHADAAGSGASSEASLLNFNPYSYVPPWNLEAPAFSPRIPGNQGPAFITPVAETPSTWFSQSRLASPWLKQDAVSQAPLKPTATIPKSWALPASPQAPAQFSRLRLQGKVLVLLRGAPGSGKTTLARALLENNPGGVILSTDDYFTRNGQYQFDPTALGEAHEWNHKRAKEAFNRGTNPVIIDNTNMQGWEMRPYVVQALRHGYKVLFKEPDSWWKHKPRELQRRTTHNVPAETIRRMLNGYERFVSVQSIMGSQVPEFKQRLVLENKSSHPVSSDTACPDLVCQSGLTERCKKTHPPLFSSLPDVSSTGRPTTNPDVSDGDDDIDFGELDSELDSQLELNLPTGDQRIPDCVVESVMNVDHCGDEMQAAYSGSIGQRVRRERSSRRSGFEQAEPADVVKDTTQSDQEKSDKAEQGEVVRCGEELHFVGDWPSEGSLKQRQVRRRERHGEMCGKDARGGASDDEKTSVKSGPDVTEFKKLLDLIQTGVAPVQTSSSGSRSLSPSSGEECEKECEAGGMFEDASSKERQQDGVNNSKGELPDCVLDWKADDSCVVGKLRDSEENENEPSSVSEMDPTVSEIGRKTVSEDWKLTHACLDVDDSLNMKDEACADDPDDCTENGRVAVTEADGSHTNETCQSPACEGFVETDNSGSNQERKQHQGRRSGKPIKLALTFTQHCPASSSNDLNCPNATAENTDSTDSRVNSDVKSVVNPARDGSFDPKPDTDLSAERNSAAHPQLPTPLPLVEMGCLTQTEPHDFALLWRLNHHDNSEETAVTASSRSSEITVLYGDSSRFVPELSSAVSAAVAVHPSGHKEVPYRVVHEKGTQVEEKEFGVTRDRLESLRILSGHFKLVSFDTLEDLYDKCHQDLEWTTNLLLDSEEKFFRDEDEDEQEDKQNNTSSLFGASCEAAETGKCPDLLDECQHGALWTKGEQSGIKEGRQKSTCGTVDESNESAIAAEVSSFGVASVLVTNENQSDATSDLERSSQTELCLTKAVKESEPSDNSDQNVISEPGLERGASGGSLDNEVIIEELRVETEDEMASMEEINRLLQAELAEIEREEKQKKEEVRSRHLDIQTLELKLSTELALQLTELFGPVGVDPGTCSEDDFAVQMDLNLAKLLHQRWKETIQERQRQAALSFHLLQETSPHRGDSQVGRYRPQDWTPAANLPSSKDANMSVVGQQEASGSVPFMDHWNVPHPHVSLRDIIKEEQALQENVQKTRQSRADLDRRDGATLLKEQQLFSLFPTIDRHFLQDIFREHNYGLVQTELFLRSLLDEGPVKTVVAPEAPRSDHHRTASKEREKRQKSLELAVANYQDTEDPEYEDFRAEASLQRRRQLEGFAKAAEAYKQGRKEVASFYAQQGHMHGQRMREANHRAAAQIFNRVNSSLLPKNILDLHGLHVDEALEHLAQVLEDKTAECEQGLCRPQLSIITGRGNHSQGGVARIRPAVIDYLTNKHYRFAEPKPGLVLVSLR
ncbi:NEDD4-binding protein 2 [Odontesthes bonariensis]|uniref:NEDD4-binding protein 2 n=1 Tax=Odontesthes bonariensis TaxID=219752 RepID=UPI003F58700E